MAINYLNSINLNKNELMQAQIENQANDTAAGTGVEGQLYYNTTDDVLKVWSNGSWSEVGGGVISLTAGTYLTNSGTAADPIIDHDDTSRTDTTSTDAPSHGGTFEAVTGVTTNATGHVTAIDVSTVTIPASENDNDFLTDLSFNTGDGILTATVQNQSDVTVDLDGRYLTGNETITLTGEVTGSGTTSISTTVADGVLDVANFNANAIVVESEGIENNDNDTTLPTSAAVKAYVDANTVGGLIYQGGYDAATNTPDLDSSPSSLIKKGWTYTVTADGTFFTEQVRVGDVIIAEIDSPTTLADWTTVQNNIDLASSTQVGIGNVIQATDDDRTGIEVVYSGGTATVGFNVDDIALVSSLTDPSDSYVPFWNESSGENERISTEDLATELSALTSKAFTITDTGSVEHGLGTQDVIVQLYDVTTGETVYADVDRTGANDVSITFATTPTNSIRVLVQKIG